MPVFGIVVVEEPTKKEREEGQVERLLLGPVWDIGKDGQAVAFKVLMQAQKDGRLPPDFDPSKASVQVSPFV